MMRLVVALSAGVIFGLGLGVSQMVDPAKVLGFLDLAGSWDPSLALVMGGALAVTLVAFRKRLRPERPVLAGRFELPTATALDARLLLGSALFGVGWGLVGLCPGPAVAGLAYGLPATMVFLAAMVAGMALARLIPKLPKPAARKPA
ncbi:MAG: YeeE/YedE family protein [Alphaproteobacteria bacterium]|nr:YeeE/YedE family protein [Alphaproteobacteria bacterium]